MGWPEMGLKSWEITFTLWPERGKEKSYVYMWSLNISGRGKYFKMLGIFEVLLCQNDEVGVVKRLEGSQKNNTWLNGVEPDRLPYRKMRSHWNFMQDAKITGFCVKNGVGKNGKV